MRKCLVLGAGGFIGGHLVRRLQQDGNYVRGVDRKQPEFRPTSADEFLTMDLRRVSEIDPIFDGIDEVYQLACEVGGLGFIMDRANDAMMLTNSVQINLSVLAACRRQLLPVFFASSACVYPSLPQRAQSRTVYDKRLGRVVYFTEPPIAACREPDAYPAHPDNEYAWEKLFSERLYQAYAANYGLPVRIGRYHNCYGAYGTWTGGREKAPAAICRKVAETHDRGMIDVWGDGSQQRSFMHVDDCVEGTVRLMRSDYSGPVNIGSSEMVTVNSLVHTVAQIANKTIIVNHVVGPIGVAGRNSDNTLLQQVTGWQPAIGLRDGLARTYPWIAEQVRNKAFDKTKTKV